MDILVKSIIENYKEDKKNKLSNIFKNGVVKGTTYLYLVKDLAVIGYEIEFIKAKTKDTVSIGIDDCKLEKYSYYKLTRTALMKEKDKLKLDNLALEKKIKKLESTSNNKAGQKVLDNKETIQQIFEAYSQGWSLEKIANKLNKLDIKTKRGGKWYKSTIKYILENREYVRLGYITEKQFDYKKKSTKNNCT